MMAPEKPSLKDRVAWHVWSFFYVCHKSLTLLGLVCVLSVALLIGTGAFSIASHWPQLIGVIAFPVGVIAWVSIRREDKRIEADLERSSVRDDSL